MAGELLTGTDFQAGKGGWQGPGSVLFVAPDGTERPSSGPDTTPVFRVTLSKSRWSVLDQRVRWDRKETGASVRISLRASPDFAPAPESRDYAPEDFREGGQYVWSARIFPRASFLIQLSDQNAWLYRPLTLKPGKDWQTMTVAFDGLKSRQPETLALCLPPGTGWVEIRSVSMTGR